MPSAGTNTDVYRLDKMRLEVVLNRPTQAVRDGPYGVEICRMPRVPGSSR